MDLVVLFCPSLAIKRQIVAQGVGKLPWHLMHKPALHLKHKTQSSELLPLVVLNDTVSINHSCRWIPTSLGRPHKQTLWWHEQVDAFQYVQEKLIAAILDALATPANLSRHLAGDLRLLLFCLRDMQRNCVTTNKRRRLNGWQIKGDYEEGSLAERKTIWHSSIHRLKKFYWAGISVCCLLPGAV